MNAEAIQAIAQELAELPPILRSRMNDLLAQSDDRHLAMSQEIKELRRLIINVAGQASHRSASHIAQILRTELAKIRSNT